MPTEYCGHSDRDFIFWTMMPPGSFAADALTAAADVSEPCLDLRTGGAAFCRRVLGQAVESAIPGLTVFVDDPELIQPLAGLPAGSRVIVSGAGAGRLRDTAISLHRHRILCGIEVSDVRGLHLADSEGADFAVVSGLEAGGPTATKTSLVLLQELLGQSALPVIVRGSLGPLGAAAACLAGAAGCILDTQLLLLDWSPIPDELKARLTNVSPLDTKILGNLVGCPHRVLSLTGPSRLRELSAREYEVFLEPAAAAEQQAAFRALLGEDEIGFADNSGLLPVGQGICFAQEFAAERLSLARVVARYEQVVRETVDSVKRDFPLAKGSLLAREHGTEYPLVQGPMAGISDKPGLLQEVADNGAIPVLATTGLKPAGLTTAAAAARAAVGERGFGVGIIGFAPAAETEEKFQAVLNAAPAFLVIAGGDPALVARFRREGVKVYAHTPSVSHLRMLIEAGVEGVILEGHEAGGHVGGMCSLVLWELGTKAVLAADRHTPTVLLAGGIANARGAVMAAAIVAPLAERGIPVGLQLGTAYLTTSEAVTCGAVSESYNQALLQGNETLVAGTTVNLPARWRRDSQAEGVVALECRLAAADEDLEERKHRFEAECQRHYRAAARMEPAAYMCGQGIAVSNTRVTMAELHKELTTAAAELVAASHRPEPESVSDDAIAIIGLGGVFPGADNPDDLWANVVAGKSAIIEVPPDLYDLDLFWSPSRENSQGKSYCKYGGFIQDFTPDPIKFKIPPTTAAKIDFGHLCALEAAHQALTDAGCFEKDFPKARTGVFMGFTSPVFGGSERDYTAHVLWPEITEALASSPEFAALPADQQKQITDQLEAQFSAERTSIDADSYPGVCSSLVAGRICNCFDLGGGCAVTDAACASSLVSVDAAVTALRGGRLDLALAGGISILGGPVLHILFSGIGALSATGSWPFDERADGFLFGDAAGVVVLKRLADARRDGDRIYAVIRNCGMSTDGRTGGITAPDVEGQLRAIEAAYKGVPFSPATISLIEAHGTGTWVGDITELKSLDTFFRRHQPTAGAIGLGSIKSMTGHCRAAAGITGLIKTALALHHRTLPPTINCEQPRREFDWEHSPLRLIREAQPWDSDGPRRAAVEAFGFGGVNAHVILEEAPATAVAEPAIGLPAAAIIFRRETRAELLAGVQEEAQRLDADGNVDLWRYAREQSSRNETAGATLAVVAVSVEDLIGKLTQAAGLLAAGDRTEFSLAAGLYFAESPRDPAARVAFLFPGQGSQYVGMAGDLFDHFACFRNAVEEIDHLYQARTGNSVLPFLAGADKLSEAERKRLTALLKEPDGNHPAMLAFTRGLTALLETCGIRPDMTVGHSLGEYPALMAAKALSPEDAMAIATFRGRSLSDLVGDNGGMAAVAAGPERIEPVLEDIDGTVTIANKNCPAQTVISGEARAVDEAVRRLEADGIECRKLRVANGFHTELLRPACAGLREALAAVDVQPPTVPVQSNLTGAAYVVDEEFPDRLRQALTEHVVSPVEFVSNVESMYAAGARLFVEVGPGSTLCSFVDSILGERPHWTINTNHPKRSATVQLLHALAFIAARGVDVDLNALVPPASQRLRLQRSQRAEPALSQGVPPPAVREETGLVKEVLGDLSKDQLAAYLQARGDFLRQMIRLDFEHFSGHPRPAATVAPAPAAPDLGVEQALVSIVARMTGYPPEVIDADADVEVELGLDSIKQVEVLHTVAEEFDVDFGDDTRAASYRISTLRELARQIHQLRGDEPAAAATAAAATQTTAPSQTPAAAAEAGLGIEQALVSIVARMTGYPPEVIDADADVEVELGLDSIKQVEVLHTVAEEFDVDFGDDTRAASYRISTLRELARQIHELQGEDAPSTVAAASGSGPADGPEVRTDCYRWVCTPRETVLPAHPRDGLSGKAVLLLVRPGPLAAALQNSFASVGAVVTMLAPEDPLPAALDCDYLLNAWAYGEADDVTDDPAGWWDQTTARIEQSLNVSKRALALARTGRPLMWVDLTSLGGTLGAAGVRLVCPKAGIGLALSRSTVAEVPDRLDRLSVDFAGDEDPDWVAACMVDELVAEPTVVDVGYVGGTRHELHWRQEAVPAPAAPELGPESTVVAIGGARGVTASLCRALAERFGSRFAIVGRSPLDVTEEAREETFEEARAAILAEVRAQGKRVVPTDIDAAARERLWRTERQVNMTQLRRTAAAVDYLQCDVTDLQQVRNLIAEIHSASPRVDLFIFGATDLVERSITDFSAAEFFAGSRSRALGLANLLTASVDLEIGCLANLTSIAGRWGNRGQASYATAHEISTVLAAGLLGKRETRWLNLHFGAWLDLGLVQRGAVKERLLAKGNHFITAADGGEFFINEYLAGGSRAVSYCGDEPLWRSQRGRASPAAEAFLDEITIVSADVAEGRRRFDLERDHFVAEHVIHDENPIVPGVISLEMMARTAAALAAPGAELVQIEDAEFPRAARFPRQEPREFRSRAERIAGAAETDASFSAEVFSTFRTPGGTSDERVIHARCRLRFGQRLPAPPSSLVMPAPGLGTARIDAAPFWQTETLKNRVGMFRNLRSFLSVSRDGTVAEVWGPCPDALAGSPLMNPIRLDGMALLTSIPCNLFYERGTQLVSGVGRVTFYATDSAQPALLARARIEEYRDGETICSIEAIDETGRVVERIERLHKSIMVRGTERPALNEPVWDSLTTPPRQADIARLLEHTGEMACAHVSIDRVAAAVQADAGSLPARSFNAAEQQAFAALELPKRQHEWLAGRLAAKTAVGLVLGEDAPSRELIEIHRAENGPPEARLPLDRPPPHITIAHSGAMAVAAAADVPIGIDVEEVRDAILEIIDDFADGDEVDRLMPLCEADRTTAATILWVAKEAARKAAGPDTAGMKEVLLQAAERRGDYLVCSLQVPQAGNAAAVAFRQDAYAYAVALVNGKGDAQTVRLKDVIECFSEVVDLSDIPADKTIEELSLSSVDILRGLSRIEAGFGFRFDPEDLMQMKSLNDVVDLANQRLADPGD